jgi:predicted ferric reductase
MPVILASLGLVLAAEVLKKKSAAYRARHEDVWNWILLAAFLLCGACGLILYSDVFRDMKPVHDLLFKVHAWTGFLAFVSGLYHFVERYRQMPPFRP